MKPPTGEHRLHLELVPAARGDHRAEVNRLMALGARTVHGQDDVDRVVLTDPDGNEFCVLAAGA